MQMSAAISMALPTMSTAFMSVFFKQRAGSSLGIGTTRPDGSDAGFGFDHIAGAG